MDSLQQPKEKKIMLTARSCFYVVGSAEYSRCKGYVVCLVGPDRCYLLWAIETEGNNHWETVPNAIDAFEPSTKIGHNTSRGTKKWFYNMTTLGLTLPNPLKPTWKHSNGKSYPTRRICQILRRPIITCSGRWHMVYLIGTSAHIKTLKIGLIRG